MYDVEANRWSKRLMGLAALVYVVSFCLPVGSEFVIGFHAFLMGLIGLMYLIPAWFANPCFWVGFGKVMTGQPKSAAVWGGFATAFAASTLAFDLALEFSAQSAGYWAWTASMLLLLIAGLIGRSADEGDFEQQGPILCQSCGERFDVTNGDFDCPMCGQDVLVEL